MSAGTSIAEAIHGGALPGRVWFYSNYHCNLSCAYCLTESAPDSVRRRLGHEVMIDLAEQAVTLGFTDLGVTGGEPFLDARMPALLAELGARLPIVVLTNATTFTQRRLEALDVLDGLPVAMQISLDAPDAQRNDELRGPGNFGVVVEAIARLVERGIRVRIATTVEPGRLDEASHARLCSLHRSLGVPDEDHLVRPVIHRGRAVDGGLGEVIPHTAIPAELTITADGAFWSPFGPTVRGGRLDTDFLITRTINPLAVPANALVGLTTGLPAGHDAHVSIR